MTREEKLLRRFLAFPKDFTFAELRTLLRHWNITEIGTGKTSGSRARFADGDGNTIIYIHKPHGSNPMKVAQLKDVYEILENGGYLND